MTGISVNVETGEVTETTLTQAEQDAINAYVPPIINATSITNKQGRLQLLALGKYSMVQPAIDSLSSPQKEQAQIEYDFSTTWDITDATVLSLMGALGITDTDLQTLFNEASKL